MELISIIKAAAIASGVSANTLVALCGVESSLNPEAINYSDRGEPSIGLCQVKLSTAQWLKCANTRQDLFRADINAQCAGEYLAYQLNRYNGNYARAITAYNAGRDTKSRTYYNKVRGRQRENQKTKGSAKRAHGPND